MIQLNLLPDVKIEYIRSKSQKRSVTMIAVIVIAASLGATLLLALIVYGYQNTRIRLLDDTIQERSEKLSKTESLDEILTIQNQLQALDSLHESKFAFTRLSTYLSQIIPSEVILNNIDVNSETNTMLLEGTGDKFTDINVLVDTLKFAEISRGQDDETNRSKPFSNVVLKEYDNSPKDAAFTIELTYDPTIFTLSEKNISLIVPEKITTRSETEKPRILFDSPSQGASQ